MSFSGAQHVKEQIRDALDIVEVVGEQLELRRQGRLFVGLCPWHSDSRPSLQVNPQRQSWKCWVCNLGGDVFSFVMQREGIGFREALEMLADRAGLTLTPTHKVRPGSPNDKRTLYRAMSWAAEQFHQYLLHDGEAAAARAYLQQRQIDGESVRRYQLGFSPAGWQWLLDRARATEFSPQVLEAVGLVLRSERTGRWYDRFRGRVLFPISDTQQRPIALGGRILPQLADDKSAKYINSPETPLFSKSHQLYGLNVVRDAITRSREVVVMEGYTDVVMARQCGVDNVVAVLGTALGAGHLQLLRRFADRIVLVLDGDEAGQRRTNEILELFVAQQIDLHIATLPQGLDPCDFLQQQGADAFRQLLGQAIDALDHKVRSLTDGLDPLRDTHRANVALSELLQTLAKAPSPQTNNQAASLREQQILTRLARQFGVDELELRTRVRDLRQQERGRSRETAPLPTAGRPAPLGLEPHERSLFELMMQQPEAVPAILEQIFPDDLSTETARLLYGKYAELHADGRPVEFRHLLLEFDDPAVKSLLVELDEQGREKTGASPEEVLQDVLASFSRRRVEGDLRRQQALLETRNIDEEQGLDLLKELLRRKRELVE